jgi:ABC-type uncharacterized transport system substrate-binding protein
MRAWQRQPALAADMVLLHFAHYIRVIDRRPGLCTRNRASALTVFCRSNGMTFRLCIQAGLSGLCLLVAAAFAPASAHPHVWVTSKAEIVFDKGQIVAIQHHWTFDEFYTAMAIQGLDKNNDGIYSREELAELAKVNMDGLKEFDYFTLARLGDKTLPAGAPADPWLEHKDGILTLHFKLPLKTPLAGDASGFTLAVFDPSFFIAFELAKGEAITLAGAPDGCKIAVAQMEESADNKTLTGAFAETLGGGGMGTGTTKAAAVTCVKS